jgi:hypothetical protein
VPLCIQESNAVILNQNIAVRTTWCANDFSLNQFFPCWDASPRYPPQEDFNLVCNLHTPEQSPITRDPQVWWIYEELHSESIGRPTCIYFILAEFLYQCIFIINIHNRYSFSLYICHVVQHIYSESSPSRHSSVMVYKGTHFKILHTNLWWAMNIRVIITKWSISSLQTGIYQDKKLIQIFNLLSQIRGCLTIIEKVEY